MKTHCQIVHFLFPSRISDSTRLIRPHRSCTRSPTTPWAWCSHPSRASPTSIPRPRWTTREWSAWGCSTKSSLTLTRWDCSGGAPALTFRRRPRRPPFLNESIHLLPQNTSEQINAEAENISSPLQVIRRHLSQTEDTKHSAYKYYEHLPSWWIQVRSYRSCVVAGVCPPSGFLWKDAVKFTAEQIWFFFVCFLHKLEKLHVW